MKQTGSIWCPESKGVPFSSFHSDLDFGVDSVTHLGVEEGLGRVKVGVGVVEDEEAAGVGVGEGAEMLEQTAPEVPEMVRASELAYTVMPPIVTVADITYVPAWPTHNPTDKGSVSMY